MDLEELQQKINVRKALKAFQLIRTYGEDDSVDGRILSGIAARSDFDGYNVWLSDARVKLHIFFHNKFDCQYDSSSALDSFIAKLDSIIDQYE